jgi:SprT-like protein
MVVWGVSDTPPRPVRTHTHVVESSTRAARVVLHANATNSAHKEEGKPNTGLPSCLVEAKMTNQELQQLVEEVSVASFHRPFENHATFNARLRTTGGRFLLKTQALDFNPHLFEAVSRAEQVGVIKHELCHYHLYRQHLGYQHRDADFKRLLASVGGSRFAPALPRQAKYVYQCQTCGQQYPRQRQLNVRRYACGRCGGKLRLVPQRTR